METGESSACASSREWCRVSSQMSVVAIDEKARGVCRPWQQLKASTKGSETYCTLSSPCAALLVTPLLFLCCFLEFLPFFWICPGSDLLIPRTHLISTGWSSADTHCLVGEENKLALEKMGGSQGLQPFALEKWTLLWSDQFSPAALSSTGLRNSWISLTVWLISACGNRLGFIIVIQVYLQKQFGGFFFLFFIIQIAENPYEKYICMCAQM